MREVVIILLLVITQYSQAQGWFQGGVGNGSSYAEVSLCDSNNLTVSYQASVSGNSGAKFSEVSYCNSTAYFGSTGSGTNFIFASCLVVLPIELINFDATAEKRKVRLNWETITELNNDYFTIERSLKQLNWKEIATIDAAGNSVMHLNYVTFDLSPLPGISYYRLKQTDFDGAYVYSNVRPVYFENNIAEIVAFPNPTNHTVTLIGDNLESLQIFNSIGQDVTRFVLITNKGKNEIEVDLQNLSSGMYIFSTGFALLRVMKN